MLKPTIFANAAAAVMTVFYVICALLSYIAPDILFALGSSWMHTINLEIVKTVFIPNLGNIVFGLVSASGLTWVTVYSTIYLYNRWTK